MDCPDPETLEQLFSGELETEAREAIAVHAARCRDCHQLVELLLDSDALATTAGPSAATALPELAKPRALQAGAAIDRYVIEQRIGHGGMGVVYAARDPELDRRIAIKVLRSGSSAARLRREAQALAKLSHPNVVAVHDVGEHDGQTFIAMALVDGVTLRVWLETERTVADILDVLRAAGRGIAAAHAAGMIHRDLKPDNIFIAHDGGVLVGDFGLAREAHAGDAEVAGTPAYMAPEQAQGAATKASDQFAFCVTGWEALYGERPFAGTTLTGLQTSIEAGAIREPREARDVPAPVSRALRRGLATDPDNRFSTMDELLAALAPRRRRWPWIAGVLALSGAATAGALALHTVPESCDTSHLLDGVRGAPLAGAAGVALDGYAARWLSARHDVCTMRDELGPNMADARTACLEQRRAAFGVVRASLANDTNVENALAAIERLPSLEECNHVAVETATPVRLASRAALALRLADLETRQLVTDAPPLAELIAFADEAERAGDAAIEISALLLVADELQDAAQASDAEEVIRQALLVAERARDDHGRVQTQIVLAHVLVKLRRVTEARNALDQAAAVLAHYGADRDLELDVVRGRAEVAIADGDHPKAIELLRKYVAGREADHQEYKLALGYLVLIGELISYGNDPAAAVEVQRKYRALEARIGLPDLETRALDTEAGEAQTLGEFARAVQLEERALAIVRSKPHDAAAEANALSNLSNAYELASDWDKFLATNELRLPLIPADELKNQAETMENLGTAEARIGHPARAIEWLEKSLALDAKISPPADPTNAQVFLALQLVEDRRYHDARVLCELLLPTLLAAPPPARPWRQGSVESALARALWEEADAHERGRALALASDAERDFLAGIEILQPSPNAASIVAILRQRLADLRAWRAHHKL